MMSESKSRVRILTVLFFGVGVFTGARAIADVDLYQLKFKKIRIEQKTRRVTLELVISSQRALKGGMLTMRFEAIKLVVDCSLDDIKALTPLEQAIELQPGVEQKIIVTVRFKSAEGEYGPRMTLKGEDGKGVARRDHAFVAKEGRLYQGVSVSDCLYAYIVYKEGLANKTTLTPRDRARIQKKHRQLLLQREILKRQKKAKGGACSSRGYHRRADHYIHCEVDIACPHYQLQQSNARGVRRGARPGLWSGPCVRLY